jgi:hypothetical protein
MLSVQCLFQANIAIDRFAAIALQQIGAECENIRHAAARPLTQQILRDIFPSRTRAD